MNRLLAATVLCLASCGTVRETGEGMKEASRWLPAPWGTVADIAGTALIIFGGHKTIRHVRKRAEAKRQAKGS